MNRIEPRDRRFLHRSTSFFLSLAGVPLDNYAQGVGVRLFESDFASLPEWHVDRSEQLERLEDDARGALEGPYSGIALPMLGILARMRFREWQDPHFIADIVMLAHKLKVEHGRLYAEGVQ